MAAGFVQVTVTRPGLPVSTFSSRTGIGLINGRLGGTGGLPAAVTANARVTGSEKLQHTALYASTSAV